MTHNNGAPLKAVIIGAGPSGIVTAKYLSASTCPTYTVTLLESSPSSASTGSGGGGGGGGGSS